MYCTDLDFIIDSKWNEKTRKKHSMRVKCRKKWIFSLVTKQIQCWIVKIHEHEKTKNWKKLKPQTHIHSKYTKIIILLCVVIQILKEKERFDTNDEEKK